MFGDVFGRKYAPVLQAAHAEIDQQPYMTLADSQITDDLRQMAVVQTSQRFYLQYNLIFYDEIRDVIADQALTNQAIENFVQFLVLERDTRFAEMNFQISLVCIFSVARPQLSVNRHGTANDALGQVIVWCLDALILRHYPLNPIP